MMKIMKVMRNRFAVGLGGSPPCLASGAGLEVLSTNFGDLKEIEQNGVYVTLDLQYFCSRVPLPTALCSVSLFHGVRTMSF